MLEGIFVGIGILLFFGMFMLAAAFENGWSPVDSLNGFQVSRLNHKKRKRLAELEIEEAVLRLKEREQDLLERQLRS